MHPLNEYSHAQDPLLDSTEERRLIDLALQPLFKATPDLPYFLHIPCPDLPFDRQRLRIEQEQWCQQYNFKPEELHRQYTTFIYHDRANSCFHLRTDVDEERDRRARERQTSARSSAPPTPPHPPVARKKISLAAYKSKRSSPKPPPEPAKSDSSKSSPETNSIPKMNGASNGKPNGSARAERAAPKSEKAKPEKRKNDSSSEEIFTPTKKVKTETDEGSDNVDHALKARPNRHGLPPMLSPIPSNPHGLPAMLSPTLPSDIEEALAEWEKRRPRGDSGTSSSSELKISPKSVKSETNGVNGGTSTPSSAGKRPPKDLAPGSAAQKSKSTKMQAVKEDRGDHNSPTKRRLLVRLKYGKRHRRDVERILRLQPRQLASPFLFNSHTSNEGAHPKPNRDHISSGFADGTTHGHTTKEAIRHPKESNLHEKTSKKRPESTLDTDVKDLELRKRRRTLEASDGGANSAPEQRDNDMRKSHAFATPKSHSMVRSLSNASAISTPRPTTPLAPPSAKSHRSTSASAPTTMTGEKAERARFLGELSRQWNDHGRKLKHAYEGIEIAPPRGHKPTPSTDHDRENKDADADADAAPSIAGRRKAVASLDCVVAYLLAFAFAAARARAVARPPAHGRTWATLLPLLHSVAHWTRHVPELEGLRNYLAYVVMRHMCDLMVASAAPGPAAAARPSPDSPEDAPSAAGGPAPAGSYVDPSFRSLWQKAKSALWRATELLPAEDNHARFPRTFASRARPAARSSSHSSSEHGGGGGGGGGDGGFAALDPRRRPREEAAPDAAAAREAVVRARFALPVGECTTCPQAARFAVAALQEWLDGNLEVGWTIRALQAPVLEGA